MKLQSTTQEEIYQMRFEDIYKQYKQRRLSTEEASEILGISVRTFLRKRRRYESEDFIGQFDLRLGKPSPHRAADQEVEFITRLYQDRFVVSASSISMNSLDENISFNVVIAGPKTF